ncbi:MAG TPA: M48 family metalloprotease [Gemmatimonadaceae bacterium]|jgi:heat shock protein HtpX|nr:M48 family metalloprotease [Gemmatimonadaceae bacterium]
MADTSVNFFAQQEANRRRTRWLVVAFILFFAWLGFGGDWILWELTRGAPPNAYRHAFPWMGSVLTVFAALLAAYAWRTGPSKVLWSVGAREVLTPATEEETRLVNVVEEMAIAAGVPRPRIWLIRDSDPNAFATGLDAENAHVAVTDGLLALCSRDELQGVIAHEVGHIKNLDVRLMTFLAALVGAVALMSDGMGRMLRGGVRFGAFSGGGRSRGKRDNAGPLVLVVLALWLLSWLIAPMVTRLLALGVSRKREFLADAMAAQFTRNPVSLANALEKIEHADAPTLAIKRGSAHLCIADPLGRKSSLREGKLADIFGTHPPMALRVARLRAMGYQERKRAAQPVEASA